MLLYSLVSKVKRCSSRARPRFAHQSQRRTLFCPNRPAFGLTRTQAIRRITWTFLLPVAFSGCVDQQITAPPRLSPRPVISASASAADSRPLAAIGSTLEDATETFLPSLTDGPRRAAFGASITALAAQLVAGNKEKAAAILARANSILASSDRNEAVELAPLALALEQVQAALSAK